MNHHLQYMYFKPDIMLNVAGKLCNSNLLPIPVLADTTSMAKSGQYPVNPNMVVFKYL